MSLKDQLSEAMKQALKNKQQLRLSVIRLARAAIKNTEIDKKQELDDPQVIEVLAREVKQRRDSIEEYRKANRDDVVAELEEEISVLLEFMPQQMTEEEIRELLTKVMAEVGAKTPKDIGKVMGKVAPLTKGKADGRQVNQILQSLLNG